jgi:WG containing repeat
MKIYGIIILALSTFATACQFNTAQASNSQCDTPTLQPLHLQRSIENVNLYKFQRKGKWGFINKAGQVIVQPVFNQIDSFFGGRAAFKHTNGKFGYFDSSGKVVIEPKFDEAMRFQSGRAAVRLDGKWGYIDVSGNLAIEPKFNLADAFYEDRAFVRTTGLQKYPDGDGFRYGVIDVNGSWITPENFNNSPQFSNGVAIVTYSKVGEDKLAVLNSAGNLNELPNIIPGNYPYKFRNGLWPARKITPSNVDKKMRTQTLDSSVNLESSSEIGFVNEQGQFVIAPQFQDASSFNYCVAAVKVEDKWGLIDTKGISIVSPQFQYQPTYLGAGLVRVQTERKMIKSDSSVMIDGIQRQARISKYSGKFGLMNLQGEWLSPPNKSFIGDPSEGLIAFEMDEKMGFMDTTGKVVVEPRFDTALPFVNRRSYVTIGSEQGYIDQVGKIIWWSKE